MSKYFHNEVDIQCIKNRCGFIWNFFSLHDHSMYYVWGNLKDDRNECRQKAKRQAQPEDERWRYRMKFRNGGLGDVEALVNCIETAVLNGADIGKRTMLFFCSCIFI